MNRIVLGVGLVAALVGVLAGLLGSGMWSSRLQGQLHEAEARTVRLERQLDELRAENERIGVELTAQRTRVHTTEADLRREQEMNARLHVLVSDGKK
jgi:hypothetical protein